MNLTTNKVSPEDLAAIKALGGAGSGNFGHSGRPGKVGGSGSGGTSYGDGQVGVTSKYVEASYSQLDKLPWYRDAADSGNFDKMVEWKKKVSNELKRDINKSMYGEEYPEELITEGQTSNLLAVWSSSANDNDFRSLSLQKAAAEEFDVEMSDWQTEKYNTKLRIRNNQFVYSSGSLYKDLQSVEEYAFSTFVSMRGGEQQAENDNLENRITKTALRAMYNNTQREFKEAGITHLEVYRGVILPEGHSLIKKMTEGKTTVSIKGANALESWSLDATTATDFAQFALPDDRGVILRMSVPVSRVVSTPGTGMGCLQEFEMVLLPGRNDEAVIYAKQ